MAQQKSLPDISPETEFQSNEFITTADIEAIQNAYDLVGLERIASIKELKKAITNKLKETHLDKTGTNAGQDISTQLTAALAVVNSLIDSPKKSQFYRLFQHSSFALLSRHPQFSKEIFRYHLTFTFYQNGQEMKMRPSEEGLRQYSQLIQQNIAVLTNLLFPVIQKLDSQFSPAVINEDRDDLTVITAENYTVSELLVLFKLIVSGDYKLPYPLRYKNDKKTVDPKLTRIFTSQGQQAMIDYVLSSATDTDAQNELHRILTLAINLEMANKDYYHYALNEVSSVEFMRNLSEWLWLSAMLFMFGGAIAYYIVSEILLITLPIVLYSGLALMFAVPVVLAVASLLCYFPVKNFNTFIANTSAMISEYFFINCWKADVNFNNLAFIKALTLSEVALNTLSVENTADKSFQKADFTLGEKAGNSVSFFGSSGRSNKFIPRDKAIELKEVKVGDDERPTNSAPGMVPATGSYGDVD